MGQFAPDLVGQHAPDLVGHFNPDLVGQYAPYYAAMIYKFTFDPPGCRLSLIDHMQHELLRTLI